MLNEPIKDSKIEVTEGWLIDIKAALEDPNKTGLKHECLKYIESKLKADKSAHQCPEWDMAFISPSDPEWVACNCLIKRTSNLKLVTLKPEQVHKLLMAGGELFDREVEPTGVAYMDAEGVLVYKTYFTLSAIDLDHNDTDDWYVDSGWFEEYGLSQKSERCE